MKYDKIALFTDLDGTLLNSCRQVSDENLQALARFTAEGGLFGISTGRAPSNALDVLPPLPINTWSVFLNGAESYHFQKQKAGTVKTLPKEQLLSLITWVLETFPHVNVQICAVDTLLFVSDPAYEDRDFVDTHQPMINASLAQAMDHDWLKILFSGSREILEKISAKARQERIPEEADIVYTTYTYLEFLPKNTNKGNCLHDLRQQPELRDRTFIAIGDYSNDLELLQEADVAVAVANALPEVKAIADFITSSNDEHALADLIENIIPTF